MSLIHDWKRIVRKAWSFRLLALAAVLSGAEIILPMLEGAIPRGVFAVASFVVTAAALVARITAQPNMYEPDSSK